MIEAHDLDKRFGDTVALRGFELVVAPGEIAGLVGHNGAGKTTFARIATGLIAPDGGHVEVSGTIGWAPQELGLYPTATARENLELFGALHGLRRREVRLATQAIARELCLDDVLDRRLAALSGGQQRRVQAATAMLHRPRVLLLDEPTVGADPVTREALLAAVRAAADAGAAIVYTTHYLPELDVLGATLAIADRGRIVARGGRDELRASLPQEPDSLDDLYRELIDA